MKVNFNTENKQSHLFITFNKIEILNILYKTPEPILTLWYTEDADFGEWLFNILNSELRRNIFIDNKENFMTDAGKEIIEIFKAKKKFTLYGNKEYYEILSFENGKIIDTDGETYGNIETGRSEISATKALKKIKEYFKRHSKIFENKSISTDEEILEYWKRWKHEG